METDSVSILTSFVQAASWKIQDSLNYYPLQLLERDLDTALASFDVRLARRDSSGSLSIMLMRVLDADAAEEFRSGELRTRMSEVVRAGVASMGTVRCSVALIADRPLPGNLTRRRLRHVTHSRRPRQETHFYWVSPGERSFQSGYRFFSFASNRQLNPCDPDFNVFRSLLRHGWSHVAVPERLARCQTEQLLLERSFSERLLSRPTACWLLVAVNLLVWFGLEFASSTRSVPELIRAGAKVNGLIEMGQYWRLVTPMFLHAGLAHLLLNTLALMVLGQTLERIYGSVQFILLYCLSGILAAVASFLTHRGIMVGASGAIFGIVGALIVYGLLHRREIPARYQAMFGASLIPLVILNVVLGLLVPQIDNAAHIGGLIAGMVVALLLRPRTSGVAHAVQRWMRRVAFLLLTAVVLASGLLASSFFQTYHSLAQIDSSFFLRRSLGPAQLDVPATWTVQQTSKQSWSLQGITLAASVRVITTENPASEALIFFLQRLGGAGLEPVRSAMDMVTNLLQTGRAQYSFVIPDAHNRPVSNSCTFVLVPDGMAALEFAIPGPGTSRMAELVPVFKRLRSSFSSIVPTVAPGSLTPPDLPRLPTPDEELEPLPLPLPDIEPPTDVPVEGDSARLDLIY